MTVWQWLEQQIREQVSADFVLDKHQAVAGGDVNQSFCLSGMASGVTERYFVKLNGAGLNEMFEKEALGLQALAGSGAIAVPQAIAHGEFEQYSYLVMNYLDMARGGNIQDFAKALAKMHRHGSEQFGFAHDNYIGKTPQQNSWCKSWGAFFAHQRIGFQLDILEKQRVSARLIKSGRALLPKLESYLNQHGAKPAIVHGDLWSGNYGFTTDGTPVIYDPAVYYGDSEVDLAMLELFGNPGKAFFDVYHQVKPIQPGYELRKTIYNLYHILNHANFFGGSYIDQSQWMIDEIHGSI